ADDTAETVASRLTAYHAQTAPLITYYQSRGALGRVDAMQDIATIATALAAMVAPATV
ncbi:MAG: adenylate kinase, partial [Pseudomonadota bacterium]